MVKLIHQPVLLEQVQKVLEPVPGQVYLDLTAGAGGHARAITQVVGSKGRLVLVDRDENAIKQLAKQFPDSRLIHRDFATATAELVGEGFRADMILMDLGWSLDQLKVPQRGFSFQVAGPLDMRMDQRQALQAADIVNHWDEKRLADLIYELGEERRSRQIAKAIVQSRPLNDTAQLAQVISRAIRRGRSRIHPATRTFQAIRMAVNDELGQLTMALPNLPKLLNPGGRAAIISFHSLEDRLVKHWLKDQTELVPLNRKPILGKVADVSNRRARSAKLRAAIKK